MNTGHPRDWHIDGHLVSAGSVRVMVFSRDRTCLAFQADKSHGCTDTWHQPHGPADWTKLTLEHVPSVHGPSDVRRNDPEHCVTLCFGANVGIPSKVLRAFCRSYLVASYPVCKG